MINWLPTSKRVDLCISIITFKFVNNACLYYLKEIFEFAPRYRIDTRNKFSKLEVPFCKTYMGQKAISFVGPSLWNSLLELIKKTDNLNTFKHNVKHYCLNWINNKLMKWVSHCYYFKDLAIVTCIYFLYFEYIFLFFSPSFFNFFEES